MKINSLNDVFISELKDLHSAETQLTKALPLMAKAASAVELRQAFEEHLEETRTHLERLDEIFERRGITGRGKKCKAMEGLIAEGKEIINANSTDDSATDAALIAAAQKVEHYEIAGYGSVRTFARLLGDEESANLLQQTLEEEKQADETLNGIAEGSVNQDAADKLASGEESSEEEDEESRASVFGESGEEERE